MICYAFSNPFASPIAAEKWARQQLPLVEKYGTRLFLVRGKFGYVIWRNETTRDLKKIMVEGRENITYREYAERAAKGREPIIAQYSLLNIIKEIKGGFHETEN